jgi:hypothetical protein
VVPTNGHGPLWLLLQPPQIDTASRVANLHITTYQLFRPGDLIYLSRYVAIRSTVPPRLRLPAPAPAPAPATRSPFRGDARLCLHASHCPRCRPVRKNFRHHGNSRRRLGKAIKSPSYIYRIIATGIPAPREGPVSAGGVSSPQLQVHGAPRRRADRQTCHIRDDGIWDRPITAQRRMQLSGLQVCNVHEGMFPDVCGLPLGLRPA